MFAFAGGLLTFTKTASVDEDVSGRVALVPHLSIFKATGQADDEKAIRITDNFSSSVDRTFTVTADALTSTKLLSAATLEKAFAWASIASYSAAQESGIFSAEIEATDYSDGNDMDLKLKRRTEDVTLNVTGSSEVSGNTILTVAADVGAARLVGAMAGNARVIRAEGTTVVVSGTGHGIAGNTKFELKAMHAQQGDHTDNTLTLKSYKGAPDAINDITGDKPSIKHVLRLHSNIQDVLGTSTFTDGALDHVHASLLVPGRWRHGRLCHHRRGKWPTALEHDRPGC